MDLNKLKTGKEFVVCYFEDDEKKVKKAHADVCKWMGDDEGFYFQDEDGDFMIPVCEKTVIKHTTIVTE